MPVRADHKSALTVMPNAWPKKIRCFWEKLLWGGALREKALIFLLSRHCRSVFRRIWKLSGAAQVYENQSGEWFSLGFDEKPNSVPRYFSRGFYAAEIIRPGDKVLDIGCGDGFFSKRFYALSGATVDAIDVDSEALAAARSRNSDANVKYHRLNPITDGFPQDSYDLAIWDGAIGHFPPESTEKMLERIACALSENGVFLGSESLGRKDHAHLTFFDSGEDLAQVMRRHFSFVQLKVLEYSLNGGAHRRQECYWRCSQSRQRLEASNWTTYAN
jgi:2-polyprenyl-3-methyl-5-hydroxy-6-metoxy-1,4-benzoquinol methylase